jgi:hypothetical protein
MRPNAGDVDLAPDAPFAAAMLAGVPLALPFDLHAGAIDTQVQRNPLSYHDEICHPVVRLNEVR